jgi:hypothetical protein
MWRLLPLVGLVFALAACHDSGDRLTQEELRRQATAVCEQVRRDAARTLPDDPSVAQIREAMRTTLPRLYDRFLDGLRELEPPRSLEARYDDLVATFERLFAGLRNPVLVEAFAAIGGLEDGKLPDPKVMKRLDEAQKRIAPLERRVDRLARELGVTACVSTA